MIAHYICHTRKRWSIPYAGVLYGRQEFVELIASGGSKHFLPVDVVANMREVIVPVHWDIANSIGVLEQGISGRLRRHGLRTSSVEESESYSGSMSG